VTGLEEVQRERVLAREVLVERRVGVPAFFGDVANARGSEPAAAEELEGGAEDLALGGRVVGIDVEGEWTSHGWRLAVANFRVKGQPVGDQPRRQAQVGVRYQF
jgi:hypothetical protein